MKRIKIDPASRTQGMDNWHQKSVVREQLHLMDPHDRICVNKAVVKVKAVSIEQKVRVHKGHFAQVQEKQIRKENIAQKAKDSSRSHMSAWVNCLLSRELYIKYRKDRNTKESNRLRFEAYLKYKILLDEAFDQASFKKIVEHIAYSVCLSSEDFKAEYFEFAKRNDKMIDKYIKGEL